MRRGRPHAEGLDVRPVPVLMLNVVRALLWFIVPAAVLDVGVFWVHLMRMLSTSWGQIWATSCERSRRATCSASRFSSASSCRRPHRFGAVPVVISFAVDVGAVDSMFWMWAFFWVPLMQMLSTSEVPGLPPHAGGLDVRRAARPDRPGRPHAGGLDVRGAGAAAGAGRYCGQKLPLTTLGRAQISG